MKRKSIRALCILLAVIMLLPCAQLFASAAVKVVNDPTERSQMLSKFNTAVNNLKTGRPAIKLTSQMDLYSAQIGSKTTGEEMSEDSKKYLAWLLDACIKPNSGLAETLAGTINGVPKLPTEADISYGEKRDNRLPLSGKKYVSALKNTDKFTLKTETTGGTILQPENAITAYRIDFPTTPLEEVEKSSLSKIFDLPNTVFDPVVISGDKNKKDKDGPLSDITFDEFAFENAFAQARFDGKNKLIDYTTSIDYTFEFSLYDAVRIISAYTKVDFTTIAVTIADSVYAVQGKDERPGKNILKNQVIYVTYRSVISVSAVDWTKRYFGDTDQDGKVTAMDARLALRHSIGLEDNEFKNQMNEVYSDIDFDGLVSASDARIILRIAVGLEKPFKDVPDGKQIKIVFAGDVLAPDAPEDDDDKPTDPFDPVAPGEKTDDPAGEIADIVDSTTEAIKDLIEYFKGFKDSGKDPSDVSGMLGELLGNVGKK